MLSNAYMALRENLIRIRKEKGWSQHDLSDKSGVEQSGISRIENGTSKTPHPDTIRKLAQALGRNEDALTQNTVLDYESLINSVPIPLLGLDQIASWCSIAGLPPQEVRVRMLANVEHQKESFAVTIPDDSMQSEFQPGDIVVIDSLEIPSPGDFVCALAGSVPIIGRYAVVRGGGIEVRPLNDVFPTFSSKDGPLKIVGRLMSKTKNY